MEKKPDATWLLVSGVTWGRLSTFFSYAKISHLACHVSNETGHLVSKTSKAGVVPNPSPQPPRTVLFLSFRLSSPFSLFSLLGRILSGLEIHSHSVLAGELEKK